MAMRIRSDVRHAIRAMEAKGATIVIGRKTGSGHLRLIVSLPNGEQRPLICPSTPSDHRSLKNTTARVRRWMRQAAANDQCYAMKISK